MPVKKSELSSVPTTKKVKITDNSWNNQTILNVPRDDIRKSIKWWKVAKLATWWVLIWWWVIFLSAFRVGFTWWEYEWSSVESIINVLDVVFAIVGLILVVIWLCRSYNILLKSGRDWLYFKWTSAIGWWAFLPIVHLWYPYKAVKDLYKHFNTIVWKSFNKGLLWRWWWMRIVRLVLGRVFNWELWNELWDWGAFWILRLMWVIAFIASSILFVKIVNKIIRAQKVYLKRTRQTL